MTDHLDQLEILGIDLAKMYPIPCRLCDGKGFIITERPVWRNHVGWDMVEDKVCCPECDGKCHDYVYGEDLTVEEAETINKENTSCADQHHS